MNDKIERKGSVNFVCGLPPNEEESPKKESQEAVQ
jgi:hypothetical protein